MAYTGLQVSENIRETIIVMFIVILFTSQILLKDIMPYLKKKMLDIKIDITNKQFKPGDKIPLDLILKNNGSKIMTNISITLIATGLLLESNGSTKIRALGIGDTKEVSYTIDVPSDSPKGDYIIQFETIFYIKTESFMKENELTISVLK